MRDRSLEPIVVPFMNQDMRQHFGVLMEAHELFLERSQVRGDMWRHFPASDKVRELRERVTRIETCLNTRKLRPDVTRATVRSDAIDLINYATFLVKQIDEGFDL